MSAITSEHLSPLRNDDELTHDDRDAMVVDHLSLADSLARRYVGRGEELDDLVQVARMGLVHAAQRYDPGRGDFTAFAVPTMTGELKRHFRDHGWLVRPTRRTQELQSRIEATWSSLSQQLGRDPGVAEVADDLAESRSVVSTALAARGGYRGVSLDSTGASDDGAQPLADRLGAEDPGFDRVATHVVLEQACRELSGEDRSLLYKRFVEERSQSDIAAELGTNQMAISRRLAAILSHLREVVNGTPRAQAA